MIRMTHRRGESDGRRGRPVSLFSFCSWSWVLVSSSLNYTVVVTAGCRVSVSCELVRIVLGAMTLLPSVDCGCCFLNVDSCLGV